MKFANNQKYEKTFLHIPKYLLRYKIALREFALAREAARLSMDICSGLNNIFFSICINNFVHKKFISVHITKYLLEFFSFCLRLDHIMKNYRIFGVCLPELFRDTAKYFANQKARFPSPSFAQQTQAVYDTEFI